MTHRQAFNTTSMFFYRLITNRSVSDWEIPAPTALGDHLVKLDAASARLQKVRYLCIAKIDDIWQLDRSNYEKRAYGKDRPYILDRISNQCGPDLRLRKCFVLIDMATEGHQFALQSFNDLHSWCDSVGLRRSDVGFLSQNRALGADYVKAYGTGNAGVRFLIYDAYINALAEKLATSSAQFESMFGIPKFDVLELQPEWRLHPFLCLNATPRASRVVTLAALRANGLLSRCVWSLLTRSSGKAHSDTSSLLIRLGRVEELSPHVEAIMKYPDQRLDSANAANARDLVWTLSPEHHRRTLVSIVTETDFSQGEVKRVTEKTIKSLAMGRPVVIFGNPHSLRVVQELGFETFHSCIDESYDDISSAADRFDAALNELLRIDNTLKVGPDKFVAQALDIGRCNVRHALGNGFRTTYKNVIEKPLIESLGRAIHDLN